MTLYEEVRAALDETGLRPQKSRGQNFLIHERVIDAIVELLDAGPDDAILEIGPGLGFLTRRLVQAAGSVWAVEVDPVLVRRLQSGPLGAEPRLRLVHEDILRVALDGVGPAGKLKVVGNLPYSISTEVFFRLLESRDRFSSMVLMVQKEVADRIASAPGTKSYGTLSVWCQVHGRVAEKIAVSPEAFFPKPKVRSTVLRIELFDRPKIAPQLMASLRGLLRAAFGQRRKTLGNSLTGWSGRSRIEIQRLLRDSGIDPGRRGETLSVDEFVRLAAARGGEPERTGSDGP